jgi:hypothetical protein
MRGTAKLHPGRFQGVLHLMRNYMLAMLLATGSLFIASVPAASAASLAGADPAVVMDQKRSVPMGPDTGGAKGQLSVGAANANISITGWNFSASGRAVQLDVYGLQGTSRTPLVSVLVTPATTSSPSPPCLIACASGSFWIEEAQPNDPCGGGGFQQIEVDASTTGLRGHWYRVASVVTTATCPIAQ